MKISIRGAVAADAGEIRRVRNAAAAQLTAVHGHGHWSSRATAHAILRELRQSHALVAVSRDIVVGTVRLETRKPWAIDASCFTPVARAVYLRGMAVDPAHQRRAIGGRLLARAQAAARSWPSDAIRLDAYDSPAGARDFYVRCGYREVGRVIYRRVPLVYLELVL